MLELDFRHVSASREERLRALGYEELPDDRRSAFWLAASWETINSGIILPASTPLELRFKLAGLKLFLEGRYPSGRAIKRELGYDVPSKAKIKLNGRECRWKHELFHTLHIEPFWWRREYRGDYIHLSADWLPYWRRGPKGSLRRIAYRKVRS